MRLSQLGASTVKHWPPCRSRNRADGRRCWIRLPRSV